MEKLEQKAKGTLLFKKVSCQGNDALQRVEQSPNKIHVTSETFMTFNPLRPKPSEVVTLTLYLGDRLVWNDPSLSSLIVQTGRERLSKNHNNTLSLPRGWRLVTDDGLDLRGLLCSQN